MVFDAVDYEAEVWLNGNRIGANAGMFRRFQFDVADVLLPGRRNRFAVRIAKMPEELAPYYSRAKENGVYDGVFWDGINKTRQLLKDLKSPTNSGWDWGISIWTLGIWKDVRLVATGPARIEDARVQCSLNADYSRATVAAALEVDSLGDQAVRTQFRVGGNGQEMVVTRDTALKKGRNTIRAELPIDKPALWWPNGQGGQPLYKLSVTIEPAAGGATIDSCSTRFGVRDVRWVHTENAPADFVSRFQLVINGRPVRTMGSNLIPPDLLFGRAGPRSLQLLHRAKAANMNMIRQWGGGVPLSDAFYDLADELGIMISVEFPLANVWPEADAVFLGNLDVTTRNIVRQVRNHPSIIEYTGGNEMLWNSFTKHPALDVLRKVVAEEDGRMFRAACPDVGARHGPHNFQIAETYRHYNTVETMRYGEFGTSSPANLDVWHRDIPPKSQAAVGRFDDPVLVHKNAVQGAFGLQDWLYKPRIDDVFGKLDDLPPLVEAGQFLGAEQMRYAMDALRRKGKRIGGFTNWDFNEPWTNGAGSYMVDYDGQPLMVYDFVRQALAPVSLSLCYDSILYRLEKGVQAELFLTSDAPQTVAGLRWKWLARDRRGTVCLHGEGEASIKPLETKSLTKIDLKPPKSTAYGPFFVELYLEDAQGKSLGERLYVFGLDGVRSSLAGLLRDEGEDSNDDSLGTKVVVELPDGPKNLAFVGNGAKPATASSSRPEPAHQATGLNDGHYGNSCSWIANAPRSWFQIDLGKPAMVGRFKLGRDRLGDWIDRHVDYLRIETSVDGKVWECGFEKAGVGSLAPVGGIGALSMIVNVVPRRAQFVKVMVDPKEPGSGMFACIDEFEVYAPAQELGQTVPSLQFLESRPEVPRPVRRTRLTVSALPSRVEGGMEVLELVVKNPGTMTALLCETHPLIEYRTDLFIDGNHCFVPPGESRTMTVRAPIARRGLGPQKGLANAAADLTLAQTGWCISCWNAEDVVVEPSSDVLLAVGRRDAMCREFSGYTDPSRLPKNAETLLVGTRPNPSALPFLVTAQSQAAFKFHVAAERTGEKVLFRLHTADQAADAPTTVEILINGKRFEVTLPKGLGLQRTEPAHLAFPCSVVLTLPSGTLVAGENRVEVRVTGSGWFTWDALQLVSGLAVMP